MPKDLEQQSIDHDPDELEALQRFLRPINPDPLKTLADWQRASERRARNKKSPPSR
jgi:hypothetical protein